MSSEADIHSPDPLGSKQTNEGSIDEVLARQASGADNIGNGGPPGDSADTLSGYRVINNFYDGVFSQPNLGIAVPTAGRRRTGRLLDSEVDEALRHYVRPAPFAIALERLNRHGIVILRGPESLGKRTGAFALLQASNTERPLVGMSPALSVNDLLKSKYRHRGGYVVCDRAHGQDLSETLEFELGELSRSLLRSGAKLVITTSAPTPAAPAEMTVDWSAPTPLELLRLCLADAGLEVEPQALAERLAKRFENCRAPAEVVDFVNRARSQEHTVEQLLSDSHAETVTKWFDQEPSEQDVLMVAALSFVHGLPETRFEHALGELEREMRRDGQADAQQAAPATAPSEPAKLRQTRSSRLDHVGLITLTQQSYDRSAPAEPCLVFESDAHRHRVIRELSARYDGVLWRPVRAWLKQLVNGGDPAHVFTVALGMATLARLRPSEVRQEYLEEWAAGHRVEREVVCYVLWLACLDDALAAWSLDLAVRWARSRSARKRSTAIVCMSGELGLRFPGEALRWLWHLATRADTHRKMAKKAFVDLFASSIASDAGDMSVLRFLSAKLPPPRQGVKTAEQTLALEIVDRLLGLQAPTGGPAPASLIARRLQTAPALGAIWTPVLTSRSHRGNALQRLRDTLLKLNESDDGLAPIGALGDAIRSSLEPVEVELLERDLYHQLALNDGGGTQDARKIVSALLPHSET